MDGQYQCDFNLKKEKKQKMQAVQRLQDFFQNKHHWALQFKQNQWCNIYVKGNIKTAERNCL